MPREERPLLGRLVHEHGAERGDGGARTIDPIANLAKERPLHELKVQGIKLEVLDLPVCERGALESLRLLTSIIVLAARAVELHEHLVVRYLGDAQHDLEGEVQLR